MQKKKIKKEALTAVDLFSGGGGLTVGMKKAGFEVVGAVEIEKSAILTYKANHPEVNLFDQDIRLLRGKDLLKLSPTGRVDLLAGCPPCQGFSSLTYKYKEVDPRNFLIREMSRLVDEVRPLAVMMENVPGLIQKGNFLFRQFTKKLERLGYVIHYQVLQVADYGVPQSRRRLVLLAGLNFPIEIPKATHSKNPIDGEKPWVSIKEIIKDLPRPMILGSQQGKPIDSGWHIVRKLSEDNQRRLDSIKPGVSRTSIPEELRPKCHKNRTTGFSNVYGRMAWDQVAPTITGGCTTLSKGRFGHPSQRRTISVREAALLQTFPSNYIFDTPFMDHVCNIIGNALPCDFATAISKAVSKKIKAEKRKRYD